MVSDLRARTGAGMMECKKALVEAQGNEETAIEILRKKGVATAAKKAGRTAEQGVVEAYIHSNHKVGVLIEVACESDFVAKNEDFRAFVRDLCMHIAAASPICIKRDEVPAELVEKEREIAMAQMAEDKKPEAIKQKIVDGKNRQVHRGRRPARTAVCQGRQAHNRTAAHAENRHYRRKDRNQALHPLPDLNAIRIKSPDFRPPVEKRTGFFCFPACMLCTDSRATRSSCEFQSGGTAAQNFRRQTRALRRFRVLCHLNAARPAGGVVSAKFSCRPVPKITRALVLISIYNI